MAEHIPHYVLNQIRTVRYAYRDKILPGDFDSKECDDVLCRGTTRASYCLVDNGDLYFTSPVGIVYYVGWNTNAAKQVYPINGILTQENVPPEFEAQAYATGPYSISLGFKNQNQEGENYERRIQTGGIRQIEWTPGVATCDAFKIGADPDDIPSYLVPTYDDFNYPKLPGKMELPFGNGYYVLQDGLSNAVVFYNGELVYTGPYNGTGVACTFSYGVEFCKDKLLCCPAEGKVDWEMNTYQLWEWDDNKKTWSVVSVFSQAVDDMNVDSDGKIHAGNVISSTADPVDGETNENAPDPPVITILPYIVDDSGIEADSESGYFHCPTFSVSNGLYLGGVQVNEDGVIVGRELTEKEAYTAEQVRERETALLARVAELNNLIPAAQIAYDKAQFDMEEAFDMTGSYDTPEYQAYIDAANELYSLKHERDMKTKQHENNLDYNYQMYIDNVYMSDASYAPIHNKRVLWSFNKRSTWTKPYDSEKKAHVVLACDYDAEYKLTETIKWVSCENGAAAVHYKTWYEGTGYNIEDSSSRFMLSQWMEECCKECMTDSVATRCSKYKCGGGCNCDPPTECGRDCYPVAVADEPKWKHVPDTECNLSDSDKALISKVAKDSGWCNDSQNVFWGEEVSVGHIRIPMQTAVFYGCDKEQDSGAQLVQSVANVCRAAVGKAKLDQLGGRIHLIKGNTDTKGNTELTDWSYIISNSERCPTVKNYTIIGGITSPDLLPGVVDSYMNGKDKADFSYEGLNRVILRAPHDYSYDNFGDFDFRAMYGTSPLPSDPVEVHTRFMKFYPAYLTCPGYEKNTERTEDGSTPLYHLHETWIPGENGENVCVNYPAPAHYHDADGYNWEFYGFQIKYKDGTWSAGDEDEINDSEVEDVYGVWEAEEILTEAAKQAIIDYKERTGKDHKITEIKELTENGLEVVPLEQKEDGTYVIKVRRLVPFPKPRDAGVWSFLGWGRSREWCERNRQSMRIENRRSCVWPENTENKFEPTYGICYIMGTRSWGDSEGMPIRCGTQVGDVYYYRETTANESTPSITDIDKYWMWNGSEWVEGDSLYSDIVREVTIFYKASGASDLKGGKKGFTCTTPKAIFSGRAASIKACGDLLAVNLDADSTYHKVIYCVVRDNSKGTSACQVVWDEPADRHNWTTSDGEHMKEGMVCGGDTYVLAVYSTGPSKQTFRLWMQDYESRPEDLSSHEHPVGVNTYTEEFSYGDVPNIFDVKPSYVSKSDIKKYGDRVLRRYVLLKSRSGDKLYVFYNGNLVKTYKESEGYADCRSYSGTIAGPRYAIVTYGSRTHLYDIWRDGVLIVEGVECEPDENFHGAVLPCNYTLQEYSEGYRSWSIELWDTYIISGSTRVLKWAKFMDAWSSTGSMSGYTLCENRMVSIGAIGDWQYWLFADVQMDQEVHDGFFGKLLHLGFEVTDLKAHVHWNLYRWNPVIEMLEYMQDMQGTVDSLVKWPWRSKRTSEGTYEIEIKIGQFSRIDCDIRNGYWSKYHGYSTTWDKTYVTARAGQYSHESTLVYLAGYFSEYREYHGQAQYGETYYPTVSMFAIALTSTNINDVDKHEIHIFDWITEGKQAACCISCANPQQLSEQYEFNLCVYDAQELVVLSATKKTFLQVIFDGNRQIVASPYHSWAIGDSIMEGDACACPSKIVACGKYRAAYNYSTGLGRATWYVTWGGSSLFTCEASSSDETVPWVACCTSGARYGDWMLTRTGDLYYGMKAIKSDMLGTTFISCCGQGLLYKTRMNDVRFMVFPSDRYFYVDENHMKDFYVGSGDEDWTLKCCGLNYYLLQCGGYKKVQECNIEYEEYTETEPALKGGTITHIYQKIKDGLETIARLETGENIYLADITTYEGETSETDDGSKTVYHYERPAKWWFETLDKYANTAVVYVDHDVSYSFDTNEDKVITPELRETRISQIPWEIQTFNTRKVKLFYKDTEISTDPRITDLYCFRHKYDDYRQEYYAEAAYSVFYDDPYYSQTKQEMRSWSTGGNDPLSVKASNEEYTTTYKAVQNPMAMARYSDKAIPLDVDWSKPCDCEQMAMYKKAYPNVCLIVFDKDTCVSDVTHNDDQPLVPFYDFSDLTEDEELINRWRNSVVYINDLNTPVRWDRFTNTEPPDAWTRHYSVNTWLGQFWLAAPTYNSEKVMNNVFFDKSGRLVAAGNNTIFVWDQKYGRLVFDAISGEKLEYKK